MSITMKMTKRLIKDLCLNRAHPRIPEGVNIPSKVNTRGDLSSWLIDDVGFNIQDQDYWDVYRLLRDEFPPAFPGSGPDKMTKDSIKQQRRSRDLKKTENIQI